MAADRARAIRPEFIAPHPAADDSFAAAFAEHQSAIFAYLRRMIGNEADAEDLTFCAFEKALKAWGRRPPDGQLRPWLFRIATNACLDELRRRKLIRWQPWNAFTRVFHSSQVALDDPADDVLRDERAAQVRQALARLSERDRAALIMRECNELPVDEIARALGISHAAAKVALFRARERLRVAYLAVGGEIPPSGHSRVDGCHA